MRRPIDAARQAGDHDEAGLGEVMREFSGKLESRGGGVAGADDRDHWPHQTFGGATHGEQRSASSIVASRGG
jgi:hypothetical protein